MTIGGPRSSSVWFFCFCFANYAKCFVLYRVEFWLTLEITHNLQAIQI